MEKTTKQFRKRNAILAYLRQTEDHPSAEMVFNQLKPEIPDLSLGTVYRNLSMFRQQGVIVSVGTVNGIERFDGNTKPHVHFICNGCDAVIDMHHLSVPSELTQTAQYQIGGEVENCSLTFTGRCAQCTKKIQGGESA